ncbi:hypothetical protein A8B78_01385 [Jannaschia sp. EhC01]|nr:hypothetical protein A8B78_01385 [Jannaschia sp. EhC01]
MSFATDMKAALPEGMHLPDAFARTFDWLEAQGWRDVFARQDADVFANHYLSVYPPEDRDRHGTSYVLFSFEAGPPFHQPPPEVVARVARLGKIAGDGGTLSLWLDDNGSQHFVVFNHGEPQELIDDPVKVLQFLAIGYSEPGAMTDPMQTATEQAAQDMAAPPILPNAFRTFLTETFGVAIPERAADLGITMAPHATINAWLDDVMPLTDAPPMPGTTPDNPFIITRALAEAFGEEGVQSMRDTFEYIVEEE